MNTITSTVAGVHRAKPVHQLVNSSALWTYVRYRSSSSLLPSNIYFRSSSFPFSLIVIVATMSPTPPPLQKTIFTGTFICTPTLTSLRVLENHAIGVDEEGVIKFICKIGTEEDGVKEWMNVVGWRVEDVRWVNGGEGGGSWWFPGFVGELGWLFFFLSGFWLWFLLGGGVEVVLGCCV